MNRLISLPLALLLCACQAPREGREQLSLAGTWELRLDSLQTVDSVRLPGTTDTNRKGFLNTNREETTHLARPFTFKGKAYYTRDIDIPANWQGKEIHMTLERTKPTRVWIDSAYVGTSDDISTPQRYDLTRFLTPGKRHRLTILVDNGASVPPQLLENSHAYTESTQTNWNGIIGEMCLEALPPLHIEQIKVYPNAGHRAAEVRIRLSAPEGKPRPVRFELEMEAFNTEEKHRVRFDKDTVAGDGEMRLTVPMGEKAQLWSEFSPALYRLTTTVKEPASGETDSQGTTFGLRNFKTKGTQFTINDLTTFLRGKHDACVFPLTGHVPMDTATWRRYFRVAKEYGINHCRFHSWCPPEACFEAADAEGFYLQPELPIWGKIERSDTTLLRFLTKEGLHIQEAYGNHASFVMMALGNELSGDQEAMTELVGRFREAEAGERHLYASGSNDFLGYNGPAAGDDYFTTCRVPGDNVLANHTRGSFSFADAEEGGYINDSYPNSEMNFESAIKQCKLPIIGHETGQFQCYPNYEELKKYTGVLKPWNLERFQERLEQAGMAEQANDFFRASGAWMARLYRAEMEMAIRTQGMAGFQLLDLQDYPGQGTALVGILDAFMDSKGLITPGEWRESCDEVVALALLPKFCYSGGESLKGRIKVANYSPAALTDKPLTWRLVDSQGNAIAERSLPMRVAQGTLAEVGELEITLPDVTAAGAYELRLAIEGTGYHNHYPLWIYPAHNEPRVPDDIRVIRRWNQQAEQALAEGASLLWFPDETLYNKVTVGGLFQTDYWNYRMFKSICEWVKKPVSPGTLGLLMDPGHPALAEFPTSYHTDWQWFAMTKQSHPFILDRLPKGYMPIIQVIDNVERNHKLGLLFELAVGNGRLLICMSDLDRLKEYPEARQLYRSLIAYMQSDRFAPKTRLTPTQLIDLFTRSTDNTQIKELGNISYDE